jgi:hypothetical protein
VNGYQDPRIDGGKRSRQTMPDRIEGGL